jgi:hypothetical protein
MKIAGLYRRGQLRRFTSIAVTAAIGGSLATTVFTAGAPAFAASGPPAPNVLVAPASPPGPSASKLYEESFTGTSTLPGHWISGGSACLTASSGEYQGGIPGCNWKSPDPSGSGALRLTGNSKSENGFALDQNALDTGQGADIRFDMYQYKSLDKKPGADGISFFLVNGDSTPTKPGQYGRALGYAATGTGSDQQGLANAIVGIGFDEFGNFSVAGAGHLGGPAKPVPGAVVARGAASTQYAYLDGKTAPVPISIDAKSARGDAKVPVEIEISTANAMDVYVGSKLALGPLDLGSLKGQPKLPPTVKFGFAASTGSNAAIHEITGLSISTLRPSLVTTISDGGSFVQGGTGTISVDVANIKTAGPTDQPVKVTIPVPAGLTATGAAGTGWSCDLGTGQVTCTRSDPLDPGASYPTITVGTSVSPAVSGTVTVTATATTPDQQVPAPASTANHTISIALKPVAPPLVTPVVTPVGTFTSPGTGTYQVTSTDSPNAGPVTGTTTQTFTIPAGQTLVSATGNGWTCTASGQVVTCTTKATAQPGDSLPPVTIVTSIPDGAPASVSPAATATTTGQATPASSGSVSIPVTTGKTPDNNKVPQVTTTITGVGTFTSPGTGTYQANVANDAAAGPTTGPTTETFNVPAGQTVTSASGNGWLCSTSGQQVTCATTATVQPGASFQPVTIGVNIPGGTAGTTSPTASVTTQGQSSPSQAPSVSIPVIRATPPPKVTATITPAGAFTSPGTGTYQVNVTDDPAAGPVTGPTTQTFTIPAGQTVTSATGDGWTCSVNGQQVTCTNPATVQPGGSLPPVGITVKIPDGASASVSPSGTVTTAGQATPSTTDPVTIPVTATGTVSARGPDLGITLIPQGALVSGNTGTLQVGISNAAGASPTTGPVTATYTVPDGSQVTSAAGQGWTCTVARWLVTCTRPGTGDDALAAGASYPPVTLASTLCHKAVCTLAGVTATVNSPGNTKPGGSTLTEDIAIQRQSSVQVTMTGTPNPYRPGKPVTYTVTVTNAGPTDSAGTKVAINVPMGFANPWTCTASFGSGCAEPIGMGSVTVPVYVAQGGTVTLTATGNAPAQAGGAASASVSLNPAYTDTQCGASCTAAVSAAMAQVPVAVPPAAASGINVHVGVNTPSSVGVHVSVGGSAKS